MTPALKGGGYFRVCNQSQALLLEIKAERCSDLNSPILSFIGTGGTSEIFV